MSAPTSKPSLVPTLTITQKQTSSSETSKTSTSSLKLPQTPLRSIQTTIQLLLDACITDYSGIYRLLFTLVLLANIIAMAAILPPHTTTPSSALLPCANAAIINLTAAILIRQPYTLNALYHAFWRIPRSTPLWIRHSAARLYEYGGIHSGAACSSLVWFVLFAAFLGRDVAIGNHHNPVVVVLVFFLIALLMGIAIFATPQMRRKYHNLFEQWHRFGGWVAIAVFWVAFVLFIRDRVDKEEGRSIGKELIKTPVFWLLIYMSISAVWPYAMLRKVRVVRTEHLSGHAVRIYFDPKERIPPQHGAGISKSPLMEWHGFAAINDFDDTEGGSSSMIISKAGDWTTQAIQEPRPYYYMKGIHMAGVGSMAKIFHRVVYMCTGSGAGPLLAALTLLDDVSLRIIWSAPNPRTIFGDKICNALLRWDPESVIWDTRANGRPDLIELATRVYREHDAEALFFISNRPLTKTIVAGLRRRGIAAYAPIFDS